MTHMAAPGGVPRATEGKVALTVRGVAVRLWCAAPQPEPRLAGGQGKPVKCVIISEPWYEGRTRMGPCRS